MAARKADVSSSRQNRLIKTSIEAQKIKEVMDDPVKWSQIFVRIFDSRKKEYTPWCARWYQAEMMQDKSYKKVYRCGRRTGKTETMVQESLHKVANNKHFRVLFVTPYENQVRLIFMRIKEILAESPLLNDLVISSTSNPYKIQFKNGCAILGFTTGSASGSGGASIRGQRADWIFLDEVDYMQDADFDAVLTIAGERDDIGITMSSTPTGRRGKFYQACTDEKLGFNEHFHPSRHSPNWNAKLEAEFRALLSPQGYVHEIEAEFGTQEMGVFNKKKVDEATKVRYYTYSKLDCYQQDYADFRKKEEGITVEELFYSLDKPAPYNPFRTVGVDFDKYGASSSILVLDFVPELGRFMVLNRIEVPRSEYQYDVATNLIIDVNKIYNPSWIYCDAGSGEYQVERLHIYGDEHPESGLKNKVVRRHFKQSLDIMDPITKEMDKKPLKQFMVNQLQIAFERDYMVLSPFDELLHKQLIDYEVVKFTGVTNEPVFTNINEHFVDALGLAYLAFVLEFPDLTKVIKSQDTQMLLTQATNPFIKSVSDMYDRIQNQKSVYDTIQRSNNSYADPFNDENGSRRYVEATVQSGKGGTTIISSGGWGSRRKTTGKSFGKNNSSSRGSW